MLVSTMLFCFLSCREENPRDPSVDQSMDGVAKSIREGRERAVEWAGEDQRDSVADSTSWDSPEKDRIPLKDSLKTN